VFSRLLEAALIIGAGFALFGRKRLPDSVRNVRKSARILKSEMQASADNVDLPEAKVIRGQVVSPADDTDGADGAHRN
jgi:Sec-independent protein translocase protein TatA